MEAMRRSFHFVNRKLEDWILMWRSPPSTTRAATSNPSPSPPPPSSVLVLEEAIDDEQNIHPQASEPNALGVDMPLQDANNINNPSYHFDWLAIIVGFSLTSAVDIALLFLQPQVKLPLLVHLLSLAIIFAFAFIFVSNFLSSNYPNIANALKLMAKLSVFAAFFFAITVPFSLALKLISWSIFGLCLLVIAYAVFSSGRLPHA